MLRVEVSRYLLLASGVAAMLWLHIEYVLTYKYMRLKFGVLEGGRYTDEIIGLEFVNAHALTELSLGGRRFDGVIADFDNIDDETQRFLTLCALNRVPVYDARQIYESLTGKVKIHRMSENNMGALLPSPLYERIKASIDVCLVLLSLPLVIPIALLTAVLVRLESPGPVIYSDSHRSR